MEEKELTLGEWSSAFKHLTGSPAWSRLTQAIQGQVDSLQNDILFTPLDGEAGVLLCERKKGMLEGRLSLVNTALGIISEIEHDMQQRNVEESE